jgi:glutamate racemase
VEKDELCLVMEVRTAENRRPVTVSTASSATADQPIGFIDSGIGGLPYLRRARELLPNERFVYLADRENFPYGVRSREEIREIVIGAVTTLVDAVQPKMVVLACNTASVVSLSELRERFSIPFVGVVPAIKPAGTAVPNGCIGVLATDRTVEDPYVSNLIQEFAPNSGLVLVPAGELVETIEARVALASRDEILGVLRASAEELTGKGVDIVVLGCTHFIHIRDELSALLGHKIPVLDSVEGVTRQIVRVCEQTGRADRGPEAVKGRRGPDLLLVTCRRSGRKIGRGPHRGSAAEDGGENYRRLAERYNLELLVHEPVQGD